MNNKLLRKDKRGEPGTPERKAWFKAIGKSGGDSTKRKYLDPASPHYNLDHFSEMGFEGGMKIRKEFGLEHYSGAGKLGQEVLRAKKGGQ